MSTSRNLLVIGCLVALLVGCGGARLKRHPEPMPELMQPLASAVDEHLSASLDWVIVKNGPGSWAKNADWDEYLLTIRSRGDASVEVLEVIVYDSLDTHLGSMSDRVMLRAASQQTIRRYKEAELAVKPGYGTSAMVATGAGLTGGGFMAASAVGGWGGLGIAVGTLAFVPVALVAIVAYDAGERSVGRKITQRATKLPAAIEPDQPLLVDAFFPFIPSPQRVEIRYLVNQSEKTLKLETGAALDGLHLRAEKRR